MGIEALTLRLKDRAHIRLAGHVETLTGRWAMLATEPLVAQEGKGKEPLEVASFLERTLPPLWNPHMGVASRGPATFHLRSSFDLFYHFYTRSPHAYIPSVSAATD